MIRKLLFKKLLFFCVFLLPLSILAQTISGKVTDSNGEVIPFASIVQKGTTNGTTSDGDGNFSLKVNQLPVTILVSSLGFTTKEEVVSSEEAVTIVLSEDAVSLDEVVVTGLASSIKRSNLANAVSTVSAEDLVGKTAQTSVDGALYGKLTGVNIISSS
ncbi:MAG TPA: SusC/RagA family TonB-linked outer membrane protein, partial [Flavobacteriia bacterium]|nr:SusC/RagA family TonB-linked outer membrane protein [Flavobacteriia bacterium]